ncbi:TRAM domain-containing protein, partial [Hydrogenivirga sp. 128-5-R1-1]|uniref:TRAM domain-containing protein n=1 Tax=Hydrogenivirga sp. 128-5-R1-1 TaxID=392423 RepID=UPI00015F1A4A
KLPMTEDPKTLSKWLTDLINVQKDIAFKRNLAYEGKTVEVLVEEEKDGKLVGRTRTNKLVHFEGGHNLLGEIVKVKITKANRFSLEGQVEDSRLNLVHI